MSDPRACEGCGLISVTAEYIKVHVTNGVLRLCRQCLDDINRKNPQVAVLSAEVEQLKIKTRGTLVNNLCPDHRDKQVGKPCLACEAERLSARLEAAMGLLSECRQIIYRAHRWGESFMGPEYTGTVQRSLLDRIDAVLAAPAPTTEGSK